MWACVNRQGRSRLKKLEAQLAAKGLAAKEPVAKVAGPTRNILMAERTALNILSRASGVATR